MKTLSSPLKRGLVLALLAAGSAQAQVAINQAAALAGGVSAGDTPGFPVTLSVPGHYVLTSNLVLPANSGGILITVPNVTLSLNGFGIIGPVVCVSAGGGLSCNSPNTASTRGISATTTADGVTIRNGFVRGFSDGISIRGGLVEDVHASSNSLTGVSAAGAPDDRPARISGVRATLNGGTGIYTRQGLIERSIASHNRTGVAGHEFLMVDSLVTNNYERGLYDLGGGATPPGAMKGTVMQNNGAASILGPTRSLGGNLIDGVAF